VTPEELLEPENKALAEELDKAIDGKIGKYRTDKEVAEELGALFGLSADLYMGTLVHSMRSRRRRRLLRCQRLMSGCRRLLTSIWQLAGTCTDPPPPPPPE
jgi:hypothetical protein